MVTREVWLTKSLSPLSLGDRIPLCAPPTTSCNSIDQVNRSFFREGFVLSLFLEDGSLGLGEVSFTSDLLYKQLSALFI